MAHPNIFTREISKFLNVPMEEAEQIQNVIDVYFNLDWSEADQFEMQMTYLAAYEFFKKHRAQLQGPQVCAGFSTGLRASVDNSRIL